MQGARTGVKSSEHMVLQPRGWPEGLRESWGQASGSPENHEGDSKRRASPFLIEGSPTGPQPQGKICFRQAQCPYPREQWGRRRPRQKAPVAVPGRQPHHQAEVRPRSRPALQGWQHGQPHVPRGLQAPGPAGISPRSPGGSETPPPRQMAGVPPASSECTTEPNRSSTDPGAGL